MRSRLASIWTATALAAVAAGCGGGGGGTFSFPSFLPFTLEGRVVDGNGTPVPTVPVYVLGTGADVSDLEGRFAIPGVSAPYTLVVLGDPDDVVVYVGLTRPDPRIVVSGLEPHEAQISGTLTGGAGYPLPPAHGNVATVEAAFGSVSGTQPHPSTGAFDFSMVHWTGEPTTSVEITAVQFEADAGGSPLSFTGAATLDVPFVADGDVVSGLLLSLLPVGTTSVSGTYSLPPSFGLVVKRLFVQRSPRGNLLFFGDNVDTGAFDLKGPAFPDATFQVQVWGIAADGRQALAVLRDQPAGAAGLSIVVPAPSVALAPLDGATGVDLDTVFSYTPYAAGIHRVRFEAAPGTGPSYSVLTAEAQVTIPDLSEVGIELPASTAYTWAVTSSGQCSSLDEVAGPTAPSPPGPLQTSGSSGTPRSFTTAP